MIYTNVNDFMHTEEHKRKLNEMKKGRKRAPFSEEYRRKMSEAGKQVWKPFEEAREFARSLDLRNTIE